MPESRIAATDRLRKEGRWDESCIFRDEVRRRLKADGVARSDANDQAWERTLEKYPPLPHQDPVASLTDKGCADAFPDPGRNPPNLMADIMWTYRNLVRKNVQPQDASVPSDWGLLLWARANSNPFFQNMLPKAMAATAVSEQDRTRPDFDGVIRDETFAELKAMMLKYSRRNAVLDAKDSLVPCRTASESSSSLGRF